MYKNFVQVILNNNSKSTDRLFTYGVPKEFEGIVQIGERVSVSFGSSKHMIEALIVSIDSRCSFPLEKIKPITDILDDSPVVSRNMIKLIFWMRERYICKYSDVLRLVTPHNLNVKSAYEKYVSLCEDKPLDEYGIKKTENQLKVINYLKKNKKERIKKLPGKLNVSYATINNLIKKNVLKEEYILCKSEKQIPTEEGMKLSEEQQKAYDEIISSENKVFLLHGVTGSGKTEVYMDVIEYYIRQNKQSIMLVPEISLTTQTIDRFRKRFGKKIAVFHSRLNRKEKSIEWSRVINRDADVVIGARSAIFAPIKNLGAIVIDEEHEDSYISSSSPKYDTTEVAIKMAYICDCKVILGSATPSINTYYMAMKKQIEKIELKRRINNQMPDIKIIDMGHELDKGNNTIISEELYDSIRTSLSKKEQVILFLNKRGYAGFVSCKKCGYVARCDRCDVSMTYHIKGNMLKCHYCGRTKKMLFKCPKCGSEKIEQFSAGTQHVEKLANKLFPQAVIERMDFDSMTDKGSYENIYNKFKERKVDILIGTQMLAKGFDFPEVTTVGVLSADAILNLPFYNSGEKTFQLITQVSGRAGRGTKKGMVFVQTYEPENFIVNAAKNNNYEVFIKEELKLRKEFAFPPFINIINVCLISKNEKLVNKTANEKYEEINTLVKNMVEERSLLLYRPVPHSIYKVNDEYRINLFMKSSNRGLRRLRKIIRSVYMKKDIENIKVSININTNTI